MGILNEEQVPPSGCTYRFGLGRRTKQNIQALNENRKSVSLRDGLTKVLNRSLGVCEVILNPLKRKTKFVGLLWGLFNLSEIKIKGSRSAQRDKEENH